jgi:hypothetical protein
MWNDTHRRILNPLSFPVAVVFFMLKCSPRRCLISRLHPTMAFLWSAFEHNKQQ